jgi:hypothetical protein
MTDKNFSFAQIYWNNGDVERRFATAVTVIEGILAFA